MTTKAHSRRSRPHTFVVTPAPANRGASGSWARLSSELFGRQVQPVPDLGLRVVIVRKRVVAVEAKVLRGGTGPVKTEPSIVRRRQETHALPKPHLAALESTKSRLVILWAAYETTRNHSQGMGEDCQGPRGHGGMGPRAGRGPRVCGRHNPRYSLRLRFGRPRLCWPALSVEGYGGPGDAPVALIEEDGELVAL